MTGLAVLRPRDPAAVRPGAGRPSPSPAPAPPLSPPRGAPGGNGNLGEAGNVIGLKEARLLAKTRHLSFHPWFSRRQHVLALPWREASFVSPPQARPSLTCNCPLSVMAFLVLRLRCECAVFDNAGADVLSPGNTSLNPEAASLPALLHHSAGAYML